MMENYILENPIKSVLFALIVVNIIGRMITKSRIGPVSYLFLLVLSAMCSSCSVLGDKVSKSNKNYYYSVDRKQILFCPMGNWFELGKHPVQADVKSFEVLSDYYWARDKNTLFFEEHRLDYLNVDLATFRVRDFMWTSDKDHVYVINFDDEKDDHPVIMVDGADPNTYVNLEEPGWAKDARFLYYENRKTTIDGESFQKLNHSFVRDKNKIYIIPKCHEENGFYHFDHLEINPVVVLDEYTIRDDSTIYHFCYNYNNKPVMKVITLPFGSLDNLEYVKGLYFKIGDKIYIEARELKGAHAATFKALKYGYMRDKNRMYFFDQPIDDVDFETLIYNEELHCYEDKNWEYLRENKVEKRSPE